MNRDYRVFRHLLITLTILSLAGEAREAGMAAPLIKLGNLAGACYDNP